MLRWYWYLCGSVYAKQTGVMCEHEDEDYERWRHDVLDSATVAVADWGRGSKEGPQVRGVAGGLRNRPRLGRSRT